jgi:hypothetical protein
MKLLILIAGILVGAAAAIAVLLLRPAQWLSPVVQIDQGTEVIMKIIAGVERGGSAGPFAALGLGRPSGGGLGETSLQHLRFSIALLDGGQDGGRALGVKFTALDGSNSLLQGRLAGDTSWNIIWPGLGTLFLVGEDDYWPELADSMRSGASGNGFAPSADRYLVGQRRSANQFHGVIGGSGALQKATGPFLEWKEPADPGVIAGELSLRLRAE